MSVEALDEALSPKPLGSDDESDGGTDDEATAGPAAAGRAKTRKRQRVPPGALRKARGVDEVEGAL